MRERERWEDGGRRGWEGRWKSTGKPLRMAVLPDTGRQEKRERERETAKEGDRDREIWEEERSHRPHPHPISPSAQINRTMSKHKMHAFALK